MMKKLLAIVFCALSGLAMAQQTPVKILVASPTGGTFDKITRALAKSLQDTSGRIYTVENRPGANNAIGTREVANHPGPDVYPLVSGTSVFINNDQIDGVTEVEPIYYLGYVPEAIVARPDFKYNTAAEMIKNSTERLKLGSLSMDGAALFKQITKKSNIDLITYKGSAQSTVDVLGGHIDMTSMGVTNVKQLYDTGKVKVLGISGTQRSPLIPNVPTFYEQGIPQPAHLGFYVFANKTADRAQVVQFVKALDVATASEGWKEFRKSLNIVYEPPKVPVIQHFVASKDVVYEILKK